MEQVNIYIVLIKKNIAFNLIVSIQLTGGLVEFQPWRQVSEAVYVKFWWENQYNIKIYGANFFGLGNIKI